MAKGVRYARRILERQPGRVKPAVEEVVEEGQRAAGAEVVVLPPASELEPGKREHRGIERPTPRAPGRPAGRLEPGERMEVPIGERQRGRGRPGELR